jgi:hypothetical protein
MIAGLLVIGVVAGLLAAATALVAGHALWVAGLAYMLGGMLGMGLGLAWGALWCLAARVRGAGMQRGRQQRHGH